MADDRREDGNGEDDGDEPGGQPGESEKQRVDRELIELLNELRVVLPGVQVLFAFLLTVPFSNGFSRMTNLQRDVFFVAFLTATVATVLLISSARTLANREYCADQAARLLRAAGDKKVIRMDWPPLILHVQ